MDEVRDKLCRVDELSDNTMVVSKRSETRLCVCVYEVRDKATMIVRMRSESKLWLFG